MLRDSCDRYSIALCQALSRVVRHQTEGQQIDDRGTCELREVSQEMQILQPFDLIGLLEVEYLFPDSGALTITGSRRSQYRKLNVDQAEQSPCVDVVRARHNKVTGDLAYDPGLMWSADHQTSTPTALAFNDAAILEDAHRLAQDQPAYAIALA